MGCSGGKESNSNAIDYDMPYVNDYKYDRFFGDASRLLKEAEDLRAPIENNMKKMMEVSATKFLINPTFEDSFRVWLWTYGTKNQGKKTIDLINLKEKDPYIELKSQNMDEELKIYTNCLQAYFKAIFESPPKVQSILKRGEDFFEEGSSLITSLKSEPPGIENMKKVKTFMTNLNTLQKGILKIKTLSTETLPKNLEAIKTIMKNSNQIFTEADAKIAECLQKNVNRLRYVMQKVYTGPSQRLDEKQIQEMMNEMYKKESYSGQA